MKTIFRPAFFILAMAVVAMARADDEDPLDVGRLTEQGGTTLEQATGYVVDRTITNFGAQFVRDFAEAWRAQGGGDSTDLTVVEKPSARWGSTIYIEANNRPLARVLLQAGRSADIKPLAQRSAKVLQRQVADASLMRLLTRDDDLGREELP